MADMEMVPLRDEVQVFAQAMERNLLANDHKGGWHNMTKGQLLRRLKQEVAELQRALDAVDGWQDTPDAIKGRERVVSEAADVANFAMMIADNFGGEP